MIREFDRLATTRAKETALTCIEAGIEAAHPRNVIHRSVTVDDGTLTIAGEHYALTEYDELLVIGGGKASAAVAAALEEVLGDRITDGAVVTNDPEETSVVEVLPGDHPVPSERGVESTRRVLELAEAADEDTLVLAVITGGGSALLPAPAEGISLDDLQQATDALLESGADIHEFNAVRKHLSAIKGGQLARTAAPATVVGLIFSDVVGNDLDVIASGPMAPDESTFADALDVLDRYEIDTPEAVRTRLTRGVAGDLPETPRSGDPVFDHVVHHVLADSFTAVEAARNTAAGEGYDTCILSSRIRGEAREAAKTHAAIAEECRATGNPIASPAVVLSGGETTVTVRGDGTGGPNQEFGISAGLELDIDGVALGCIDTDGIDGASDAAGAIVDASTVDVPGEARDALASNDAYPYLQARDALIRTGPTGTNVNDLRVLVIESNAANAEDDD